MGGVSGERIDRLADWYFREGEYRAPIGAFEWRWVLHRSATAMIPVLIVAAIVHWVGT